MHAGSNPAWLDLNVFFFHHQITLQIKHPFTICLGQAKTLCTTFFRKGFRRHMQDVCCNLVRWVQHKVLRCSILQSKAYRMSDNYNIKAKNQLYCYLSVTWLLSEVVGPAHLETICSQTDIGQQEAMSYKLV